MKISRIAASFGIFALASCAAEPAPPIADSGDFEVLVGEGAASFELPSDTELRGSRALPHRNATYERYQQRVRGADVLGGQITMHRSTSGSVTYAAGRHFDVRPSNRVVLSKSDAVALAAERVPAATEHNARLMIDPSSGQFFYAVDSRGEALRQIHWFDAQTAGVLRQIDALTTGCDWNAGNPGGVGFDGADVDLTELLADASTTTLTSSTVTTRDLGSWKKPFYGTADEDADQCWDAPGRESPGQGALVSAHHHVSLTDDYFKSSYGFDLAAAGNLGTLTVWTHYQPDYVNAYWDGTKMVFGDGDGIEFREMVAMDIAAHELSHGVTEFTSNLVYSGESGALNEAFSDIMGATVGFATGLDDDWLMGEDSDLAGFGLRNMADPGAYTYGSGTPYPANYCERYTGTGDNGGVHINSSIANHAYYLLVTGGVPLADAAQIFYDGFTSLTSTATFLDARAATVALGGANAAAVAAAWDAVGVVDSDGDGSVDCAAPPAPDCSADGQCNAECADGADPDCSVSGPDCSADGQCNAECAEGEDPDCDTGGTCEASGTSCSSSADCCSGKCHSKGKKAGTCA